MKPHRSIKNKHFTINVLEYLVFGEGRSEFAVLSGRNTEKGIESQDHYYGDLKTALVQYYKLEAEFTGIYFKKKGE